MMNYTLNLKPLTNCISDRDLQQLCRENPEITLKNEWLQKTNLYRDRIFTDGLQPV